MSDETKRVELSAVELGMELLALFTEEEMGAPYEEAFMELLPELQDVVAAAGLHAIQWVATRLGYARERTGLQ
jgi:hypothetical protein